MTQGERIKIIRKSLNLTLEKFGEKLGVQRGAISNLENGTRNLTEQMAVAICRTYNVNYDYLISGDGEMFSNIPETVLDELCKQYDLDDLDRLLVELYIGLSEQTRAEVKDHLKVLIQEHEKGEA